MARLLLVDFPEFGMLPGSSVITLRYQSASQL
jgi:hypothetical protein